MKLYAQVIGVGSATGCLGAALGAGSVAGLGGPLGYAVGLPLSLLVGGLGGLIIGSWVVGRVESRLDELAEPTERPQGSIGWASLDARFDDLESALAEAGRAHSDLEDLGEWARRLTPSEYQGGSASSRRVDLRALVEGYRRASAELAREVAALGASAERMGTGADDQAATVARTASSVEALSDRIDRISQNAEEAAEASQRTREEARRGLEQIQGLIAGMDRLNAHVEGNVRKARRLGDRSEEIGTIVELIGGLSSRTDMLALNATIESVRAGEHGRGFAVVAEEIRKLAERAANATREVGTLVEAIRTDVHGSVRALAEEQSEVEQESRRVREAGAGLDRISQFAEHSARLVAGISLSANDQVEATQDLVRAIQRISEVTTLIRNESSQLRTNARELAGRPSLRGAAEGPPASDLEARSPSPITRSFPRSRQQVQFEAHR